MARVLVDEDGSGIGDAIEAQRAAAQVGDWWALVHATFWRANSIDGISPATIDCLRTGREALTSRGAPHVYVALISASEAAGLLHLGRWRECLARLREVFGVSPDPITSATARLVGAQLACWQGRGPEAEAHLARAEELLTMHSFPNVEFDAVRAELAVAAGQTERVLALVPDGDDGVPPTLVERLIPLAGRAMADRVQAIRDAGGDDRETREHFRAFRQRHPTVIADLGPGEFAKIQIGAMQAWYDAEFERAERSDSVGSAWLLAADRCHTGLLVWDEAYARTRTAEALLPKRTTHAEGVAALRRAWELASDLEAAPMLAQISTLAQSAHVRLAPPESVDLSSPPLLPGLTPREREILAHVLAGRTYGEIASALVISEKTVSAHISNLLRKTGTTSRVDLAQLVHRSTAHR
jgi:DNA-binding CsgD family transcriptional regulator